MPKHIHPILESMFSKSDKEGILNQTGSVFWLTGLSGSGKSTLAGGLEQRLHKDAVLTQLLDGDNLRSGLNSDLGFTDESRIENIRRVAEVAKLFCECGIVTICSFVSPTREIRRMARDIVGLENFYEIFVKASFETCAVRDVKGLYEKALSGEIKNFTGLDAPFEEPEAPYLLIDTESNSVEESIDSFYDSVIGVVKKKEG